MKEKIALAITFLACFFAGGAVAMLWTCPQSHSENPSPSIPASEFLTSENEVICAPNSTCVSFTDSYLKRLELKAFRGDGEFRVHTYQPMMFFSKSCGVSFRTSKNGESREVDFSAPTCEQAAKLVVERLVEP